MQKWHLVRTKPAAEKVAQQNLRNLVEQSLLPLARVQLRDKNRIVHRVSPLFPSYLFALFRFDSAARRIRYTPGIREIVRFGELPAVVPDEIIDGLMLRCSDGPMDLSKPAFAPGCPLEIVDGPFREFRGIFEGYLSGTERVAVLLSVMNAERRVVMPAQMVIPAQLPGAQSLLG